MNFALTELRHYRLDSSQAKGKKERQVRKIANEGKPRLNNDADSMEIFRAYVEIYVISQGTRIADSQSIISFHDVDYRRTIETLRIWLDFGMIIIDSGKYM